MLKLSLRLLIPALTFFSNISLAASSGVTDPGIVELQTNLGTITVQLNYAKAPVTSKNFMNYVASGFYKDTLIHRTVKGFVVQGGGFDKVSGQQKPTNAPIKNEASNGLSNLRGTIAMARTDGADTATSQFFINAADNTFLNYLANKSNPAGYAVFGKVIKGMAVVDKISGLAASRVSPDLRPTPYEQLPHVDPFEMVSVDNVYTSASLNSKLAITRIMVNGKGKVTSSPAGINCGISCTKSQAVGTALKLTAVPAKGYYFAGWRGDCEGLVTTVSINTKMGNHNCTALFSKAAVVQ